MKLLSRVVWSEGMYLGPHHFQSQSRYFEDSIRFAIEHAWFEPWGLTTYALDGQAIRNGRVALLSAHGVFEDGLVFTMPECDPVPTGREIKDLFPALNENFLILLAVPKRQDSGHNCDLEGEAETARYHVMNRSVRDMTNGAEEKEIRLGKKNIRLITENELQDDLITLPLARVKRDGAGHLMYDEAFIPPCTKLTASDRLMMLLRQIIEVLEEKRNTLMVPRSSPGKFQTGMSQLEVANFWFLHTINSGLAALRHIYEAKRGHPEELFRQLSRLAGALCTFSLDFNPADLPIYNHRQLDSCFESLNLIIRRQLEVFVPTNTVAVPLKPASPNFFAGEIKDDRCLRASRWVLGLGSSAGEAQVLTKAPHLVKVCSALFVSELVRRAMPGLPLVHLSSPPSALSPKVEMQYFSISKSGPCWNHIQESRQVGIYVPNDLPNPIMELQVILDS